MVIRSIVRSLGDYESSDSDSDHEAADTELLSDDEGDGDVLGDIDGGSAWDTRATTGECIRELKECECVRIQGSMPFNILYAKEVACHLVINAIFYSLILYHPLDHTFLAFQSIVCVCVCVCV